MDDTRTKLAIAVIAYGSQVCAQQAEMWLDLGTALATRRGDFLLVQFAHWDINPVDRARNIALASAMTADADWLLMVDADTFVPYGGSSRLLDMIEDAAYEDAAIVVAPVRSRGAAHELMAYRVEQIDQRGPDNRVSVHVYKALAEDLVDDHRGLIRVDAASAAVMAINLHSVGDASFHFTENTADRQGLSEDLWFCQQIRAAGKKIYCDTRVATGHLTRPQVLRSEP